MENDPRQKYIFVGFILRFLKTQHSTPAYVNAAAGLWSASVPTATRKQLRSR